MRPEGEAKRRGNSFFVMAIPKLSEDITERIGQFINEFFVDDDADWDALVTEAVSLIQALIS